MASANEGLLKFGKYHTVQYILIFLPILMVSMMNVNYIFVAQEVNYRCLILECEDSNAPVSKPVWWPKHVDEKCTRPIKKNEFSNTNTSCDNSSFSQLIEECDEWIYENTDSVVSELNLACQPWKVAFIGVVHSAGMIVSMFLVGALSDKFGRKPMVILCAAAGVIGVLKAFTDSYYNYISIEFTESTISSGIYTAGVVLLAEIGGEGKSVEAGIILGYAVYAGEIVFGLLAMALKHWKYLIFATYTPMLIFLLYFACLKESFRWRLVRGNVRKAKEILKVIVKTNKLKISAKEIDDMHEKELRSLFKVQNETSQEGFKNIIKSKEMLLRLIVASFCFFTAAFTYYGLAINAVRLPGDKYINFLLTSLISFGGDLTVLYSFKKYGRRCSLQFGYVVTAGLLLAHSYTPDTIVWLKVALFLGGRFGITICFTGMFTYSLELFPTSVRGSLVGCANTCARIGGTFAPITPLLDTVDPKLSSILFASTSVVAALLLTCSPETINQKIFDTIAEVEADKKTIITVF